MYIYTYTHTHIQIRNTHTHTHTHTHLLVFLLVCTSHSSLLSIHRTPPRQRVEEVDRRGH